MASGLRAALVAQGHEIADYVLTRRMSYHAAAMEMGGVVSTAETQAMVCKQASENVIVEVLYHRADLVLVISGLNFHPIGLWLLDQMRAPRIPVAVVFTESPYEDRQQKEWVSAHPEAIVFTHDRFSARRHGWHYLPHAFDPDVHRPVDPDPDEACDVLLVATGWPARQELIEKVNWTGIKLRLIGPWPNLLAGHPLKAVHEDACLPNSDLPRLYASAKICLNHFRPHPQAESLSPRSYEVAGCGAFQISDPRPELIEIFGETVPTYRDASELEGLLRYYLAHDDERRQLAARARALIQGETFLKRVSELMRVVQGAAPTLRSAGFVTT